VFNEGFLFGRYGKTDVGCYHMSNEDVARKEHEMFKGLEYLALGFHKNVSDIYQVIWRAGFTCGARQKEEEEKEVA